jgi:hypothetical protein
MRAALLAAAAAAFFTSRPAAACSPPPPVTPTAIPRPGAIGVPTTTTIVVLSRDEPFWLTLTAGSEPVPIGGVRLLGQGMDGVSGKATQFWAVVVQDQLAASTEHVLTMRGAELTRFTTAAGYDKSAGTAPAIASVKFWRVRYPPGDIQSGNCVGAEHHGFVELAATPATVPDTPADSIIYRMTVWPEAGGPHESFTFTGPDVFSGNAPDGDYPTPTGRWQPDLTDATRYCLDVTATGFGDQGRLPLTAGPVCARVVALSAVSAGDGCAVGEGKASGQCIVLIALTLARARRLRSPSRTPEPEPDAGA